MVRVWLFIFFFVLIFSGFMFKIFCGIKVLYKLKVIKIRLMISNIVFKIFIGCEFRFIFKGIGF